MDGLTEITQEDFEKDMDSYMDRIEKGELFLIRLPDGRAVAAVPAAEEVEKMVDIMPEIGYDEDNPRKWR